MKKAFHLGTLAALLPFAALAQSPSQDQTPDPSTDQTQQPAQGGGATFESLDTNSDGRISKAEAEANANVKAQFSSYDVNGDGYIERSEVSSANNSHSETPKQ